MTDTSVRVFYSGNTGAPICAGTAGYGIALLDACLVNGFNIITLDSLVIAGNVATVTKSAGHGFTNKAVVVVSGATPSGLNGEWKITVVSSTVFTFATTGISDQTATGTMTAKVAPLGWEKVYSGTNKAAYRSQVVTGSRLYLRADDSNATYLRVTMYETMTDVDTGTGASSTFTWMKNVDSNTVGKPWLLVGNSKIFYWFVEFTSAYVSQSNAYVFGDILTVKPGDSYHCVLIGHARSGAASGPYDGNEFNHTMQNTRTIGQQLARSHTQAGGVIAWYKRCASNMLTFGDDFAASAYYGPAYPNAADNSLHLVPVYVYESSHIYRGRMPGLYAPLEKTNGAFYLNNRSVSIGGATYVAARIIGHNNYYGGNCWLNLDEAWV